MSGLGPAHNSGMLISPRANNEVQQLLIETRKVQLSRQADGLKSMPPRFSKLESIMESCGLEGAGLLCSSLSQLSKALIQKPAAIGSSQEFEAFGEGVSRLAEYVSLVSARIWISPMGMAEPIIRIQKLLGNTAITPMDLFRPHACLDESANASFRIAPNEKSRVIDQSFHILFRENLSVCLKEQESKSLDAMTELFDRIKSDDEDPLTQLAYLVSSFVELVQYESDKFGVEKTTRILLAEVDFLIRQICRSDVTGEGIELPESLLQKMLFLIGDAVYGRNQDNHVLAQHIGPHTGKICERFLLEEWLADSPDQVMQAECRKSIQLAEELSQLARKGNYHSLRNSLALFFLGGLDSKKTAEMFAKLDELKKVVSVHAHSVLRTYVVRLCEAIVNVDINTGDFPDSQQDAEIASAWMMLWSFVEDPHTLTVNKIHCLGQRIAGDREKPGGTTAIMPRSGDIQQGNSIASDAVCNNPLDSDVNFMHPWPDPESTESSNALIAEAGKGLSTVTDILAEIGRKGVTDTRLGEVQSAVDKTECLFAIAGDASAMEITRRTGSLMRQMTDSGDHAGTSAAELSPIIDSIREGAVKMPNPGNPVRDMDFRFDQALHLIEEYLVRQETLKAEQSKLNCDPIADQLNAIRSELEKWQAGFADREIAVKIREEFTKLAKLCETGQHEDMSRICNAVVPMIREENLKTASDSTVILNLLLEVHQSIETELKEDPHARGHLGSILRMVEKL